MDHLLRMRLLETSVECTGIGTCACAAGRYAPISNAPSRRRGMSPAGIMDELAAGSAWRTSKIKSFRERVRSAQAPQLALRSY